MQTLQIVTSVTHWSSEIRRSRKELTFCFHHITLVLNHPTDLSLSHDAWLFGGSNSTEFGSSPGSHSLSRCSSAAGGAKPEPKLLSLHLPSALARNILPAFHGLDGPSSGAACLHVDPNATAVPASQATCSHRKLPSSGAQIRERRRHVLTSARFDSSPSLMHHTKVGNTACAHWYK